MYGLFIKLGAGAVVSAGVSLLGLSYLCTDPASNQAHRKPPAIVAVQADAALGAGVVAGPGSHGPGHRPGHGPGYGSNPGSHTNPGSHNPGSNNPGSNNPGSNNPGSNNPGSNNPGSNNPAPGCGCTPSSPPLINVEPDVDVDVDVVVKLPDTDLDAPELVSGVVGTVGAVVGGVLPDCGCPEGGAPALPLPLPLLGH